MQEADCHIVKICHRQDYSSSEWRTIRVLWHKAKFSTCTQWNPFTSKVASKPLVWQTASFETFVLVTTVEPKSHTTQLCPVGDGIDRLPTFIDLVKLQQTVATTAVSADTASHLIKRTLRSRHVQLDMSRYWFGVRAETSGCSAYSSHTPCW